ncbi:3-mercaptopyruvate sulfurtransferase [Rhizobiales bacterium]|uniref:3-mercaptopyruvate sulfurtransferase n=1 Tax=Hongsoonwoonella zoysiae TaxID=2821844 RepID=UPI001560C5B9|nr:3-mercaptopyruvate sulfurtransferase [Hongsoonwoonella zoysiae]NRG19066.1 3-mercaptopyruvate sulfurtransferase [Hongsoonwoonella zoysiae]
MTDSPIVSTEWLAKNIDAPDLVVVDGSWYLPAHQRDPKAEYRAEHIPGAVYFDIDDIADTSSSLPHMLPAPHVFSSKMRKLGIGDGQTIVVYDGMGLLSAARVWWMFKAMGVESVYVLDGGLPKWKAEGRPVDDDPVHRPERHFSARLDNALVRDYDMVRSALGNGGAQVVDARSAARFKGEAPEPRPELSSGHMPGSLNLPFDQLLENGALRSPEEIETAFRQAGVDYSRPVITSCGSGVTAAILFLALDMTGHRNIALYDGSWTDWASRDGAVIEKNS